MGWPWGPPTYFPPPPVVQTVPTPHGPVTMIVPAAALPAVAPVAQASTVAAANQTAGASSDGWGAFKPTTDPALIKAAQEQADRRLYTDSIKHLSAVYNIPLPPDGWFTATDVKDMQKYSFNIVGATMKETQARTNVKNKLINWYHERWSDQPSKAEYESNHAFQTYDEGSPHHFFSDYWQQAEGQTDARIAKERKDWEDAKNPWNTVATIAEIAAAAAAVVATAGAATGVIGAAAAGSIGAGGVAAGAAGKLAKGDVLGAASSGVSVAGVSVPSSLTDTASALQKGAQSMNLFGQNISLNTDTITSTLQNVTKNLPFVPQVQSAVDTVKPYVNVSPAAAPPPPSSGSASSPLPIVSSSGGNPALPIKAGMGALPLIMLAGLYFAYGRKG